jgi:hypothetical protein
MLQTMVQYFDVRTETTDHDELLDSLQQWTMSEAKTPEAKSPEASAKVYRRQIVWVPNALGFLVLHIMGVYATYLAITQAQLLTLLWSK